MNISPQVYQLMRRANPYSENYPAIRKAYDIINKAETQVEWLRDKVVLDPEKAGLIGFPKSERNADQLRFGKPKTFIQFCAKHANIEISKGELDTMAYEIGNAGILEPITHRIVEGEELFKNYGVVPSCFLKEMRVGAPAKPLVRFYSENPEKIKLIVFTQKDEDIGRALLWHSDDGKKLIDYVYCNSHHAITHYAESIAEENGWEQFIRYGNRPAGIVISDLKVTEEMPPYFDAIQYVKGDFETITLSTSDKGYQYYRDWRHRFSLEKSKVDQRSRWA